MNDELLFYANFLVGFIFINFLIYFLIQIKASEKIFRKLCVYWLSILLVVIFESIFTEGKLILSLVFLVNFIPIALMANFMFEMYDHKFNLKKYLPYLPISILLSVALNQLQFPFYVICLPIMLMNVAPIIEFLYLIYFYKKQEKQIEKIIISIVSAVGLFSCVYYCIYRFDPTPTQYLIGFGSGFLSYMTCSILLPILCIKIINRKKTLHLEEEVSLRTKELNKSKQEKEELLRVLVHDISNPIQAMMLQVNQMRKRQDVDSATDDKFSEKIYKNIITLTDIIAHVREYESILSGKKTRQVSDVYLKDCLLEIEEMFSDRFLEKHIELKIYNKLPLDTKIKVDRIPFIHSVASNLVSNALKFSKPHSEVVIAAYDKNGQIIIDVIDTGIGMSKQNLNQLFDITFSTSRQGTQGERGTGFGMSIVKAYTTMFGADIQVQSSQEEFNSGTTVSIIFPDSHSTSVENLTYLQ